MWNMRPLKMAFVLALTTWVLPFAKCNMFIALTHILVRGTLRKQRMKSKWFCFQPRITLPEWWKRVVFFQSYCRDSAQLCGYVRLLALQRPLPLHSQVGAQQLGLYKLLWAFLCSYATSSSFIAEACLHWSDYTNLGRPEPAFKSLFGDSEQWSCISRVQHGLFNIWGRCLNY